MMSVKHRTLLSGCESCYVMRMNFQDSIKESSESKLRFI